jgi:hypothetical protein
MDLQPILTFRTGKGIQQLKRTIIGLKILIMNKFKKLDSSQMFKKWYNFDKRGQLLKFASEYFGQSGLIVLERVGNTWQH